MASIERYDLETGLARKEPIFFERVIASPAAPLITSAADALAVTLAETGRVDLDHLADLIERDQATALAQLGTAIFRNPRTESWETADAYLSGAVRTKLAVAEAAAAIAVRGQRSLEGIPLLLARQAADDVVGSAVWRLAEELNKAGADVISERVAPRRTPSSRDAALARIFVATFFGS